MGKRRPLDVVDSLIPVLDFLQFRKIVLELSTDDLQSPRVLETIS